MVNGHSADVLIVFAITDRVTLDNDIAQKFSAFVVDKQSPGISWQKIEQSGTEIADITFENARIPAGTYMKFQSNNSIYLLDNCRKLAGTVT